MYVPGPDQTAWWDRDAIVERVKRELRLQPAPAPDLDDDRWGELVDTAGGMVNTHLDRRRPVQGPVPDGWVTAIVEIVKHLAGSGVALSDPSSVTFTTDDPLAAGVPFLRGGKSRFGIA